MGGEQFDCDSTAPRRTGTLALLVVLTAAAALIGLTILLAPAEDIYGPGPAHAGGLGEELDRGNIAYEIQHGPLLDLLDYQWATFFGGSLVMGMAAAPLFALLGPNLFALKLTPLLFHLATLSLVILVLDRFVSRRAAWIGGLLMAFCPPGYALMTTICFGTHVEQNLFSVGSLFLCLAILRQRPRDPLLWLAWGCLAGVGIYFSYTFLVVWAVCAVFILIAALRRAVGGAHCVASYLAGFLVGLAPWLLYNVRFGFVGTHIYAEPISSHFSVWRVPAQFLDNLLYVVFVGLPDSSFFGHATWFGVEVGHIYVFSLLALTALAAWSLHRRRGTGAAGLTVRIQLLYVVVYLVVLSSSGFVEAMRHPPFAKVTVYRYLMPVYPFLFMLAAVTLASVSRRSTTWRWACVAIVSLLCATSVVHTLRGCDAARFGALIHTPAFSVARLGEWFVRRFPGDLRRLELVVDGAATKRSPEYRAELYRSMGSLFDRFFGPIGPRLAYDRERLDGYAAARRFLRERAPAEFRDYFAP